MENGTTTLEPFFKKVKNKPTILPEYLPKRNESTSPHKDSYMNIRSSFISNSQKLESIHQRVYKSIYKNSTICKFNL